MNIFRRAATVVLVTIIAASTLAACVIRPADPPGGLRSRHYYLALGDSVATGEQPDPSDRYYREDGYVPRVWQALAASDPKLALENLGCGGETTMSMIKGTGAEFGACGPPQFYELVYRHTENQLAAAVEFLRAHPGKVDVITLTIGGNDAQDPACAPPTDACLQRLAGNLGRIVDELHAAAPRARIVGTTIYNPIACLYSQDPAQAIFVQELLQKTNKVLVDTYRARDVVVADVAAAFAIDDIEESAARASAWTWFCSPDHPGDAHPNDEGNAVIADTVLAAIAQTEPAR